MYSYKYRLVIKIVAILSIITGTLVISGWVLNSIMLVTLFRNNSPMKFATAGCLVLSGTYLLFLFINEKNYGLLQKLLSLLIILIGAFSFFGNIYNYDFIVNKQFVKSIGYLVNSGHFSGNMSIANSLSFFLLGLAYFNLKSKRQWIRICMQWALHIVTLMSLVAMMGHLYKVPGFYKIPFLSPMAMHTAIALFCLSVATSLVNSSFGITGLLTGDKTGNIMARRLFPMIAFLLLGITYIRLEIYREGALNLEFTTILFTTFFLLVNLFLIWRTAIQLNKIDTKRKIAEDSILVLNKNLEQKVEQRTETLKEALLELEKSQNELSEALDKEKELNEIKSRFVSMASHEFKTPLSTILSSASLISRYEDKEGHANRDRHVQRIKNSVKHLNELLEDFLSLGSLEAGRTLIDNEDFNLKEFLQELMEEINVILKPGQTIQLKQNGINEFATDKRLLKNILLNILSNAIKFSHEYSCIKMCVNTNEDGLFISVEDSGIGIPEEDKKYLFSSFFRGTNVSNIQGTGLGLHIVKRYVDLLNGSIQLQSELEKGTIIMIELPLLKVLKEELV
jgi:signal transduction histidine kinase